MKIERPIGLHVAMIVALLLLLVFPASGVRPLFRLCSLLHV